jgi:hypothetical protein
MRHTSLEPPQPFKSTEFVLENCFIIFASSAVAMHSIVNHPPFKMHACVGSHALDLNLLTHRGIPKHLLQCTAAMLCRSVSTEQPRTMTRPDEIERGRPQDASSDSVCLIPANTAFAPTRAFKNEARGRHPYDP